MKNNGLLFLAMLIIYSLFLAVAVNTPMHSDDYWYSLLGMDPTKHYAHYMNWSGRVVADYTSTILLSIKNHNIRAAINSLAATLLIYNISMIPGAVSFEVNKRKTAIISLFIFLLYWISNPALGQTAFWIVGSANYLWTTLIVVFFIRMILKSKTAPHDSIKKNTMFFTIGVLAGCSNENTSVTLVVMSFVILACYRHIDGKFDKKIVSAFAGAIAGCAILILAPGNFVRASDSSLDAWRESSLTSKIFNHITKTMPEAITQNLIALIYLVLVLSIVLLLRKRAQSLSKPAQKIELLVIFFVGAFLCANMAMALSPVYPPRAMHGPLIFLLCATSLALTLIPEARFKLTYMVMIIPCVLFFLLSYAAVYLAFSETMKQAVIRENIIKKAISGGEQNAFVPKFYFRSLIKAGDRFDTYHSTHMGLFYGIKKTTPIMIPFDYSVISGECKFRIEGDLFGAKSSCLYTYMEKLKKERVFIIEFDKPFVYSEDSNSWISIQGRKKDGDYFKLPDIRTQSFLIDGKYYVYSKYIQSDDVDIVSYRIAELDSQSGLTGRYYTTR